ncbi:MAG TPA: ligase-associated DNA damage response exonuclease [Saprospiraceae bacterium]|nr:ligase-associated DNA damage response exonuclease [Saprospiraceae bacterium]
MSLLEFTERGVYCQKAGIFIDPWKSVPKALITHAHSDHAQPGCQHYLCTHRTAFLLRHRLGVQQNIHSVAFKENVNIHGVNFSFHPAGHIVGSAQIRVEHKGEIWVVSGDYKTEPDDVSEDFEIVKCHTFITESTFGLPVYQWPDQNHVFSEINAWWESNSQQGITSVLSAYSLGKSQRIIQNVDHSIGPLYCHGSIEATNEVVRQAGVKLKLTMHLPASVKKEMLQKALVIAPGSALSSSWMRRFKEYSTAAASGWMILRGRKSWHHVDKGFVLSDHADWNALNTTVKATGCEQVIVTHGYSDIFARWLQEQGYHAQAEKTTYEGESEEIR